MGALALSGCEKEESAKKPYENSYEKIRGIPLSVGVSYGPFNDRSDIATVIEIEGKKVLGYARSRKGDKIAEAAALIQSEINDGDDEPIELTGSYNEDKFSIDSIRANGYVVNF